MMKNHLPPDDLANICTMQLKDQKRMLERKRSFKPPHSLNPVRNEMLALHGVRLGLFPDDVMDDKSAIKAFVASMNREQDRQPNKCRAEAIMQFRRSFVQSALEYPFRSHRITIDNSLSLTHSLALQSRGKGYIPYYDLRKSGKLTERARDFVFSMNFHLIIDALSEFREFGLMVLNYWEESANVKGITPYFFSGRPRYTYEELTDMIARTHELWLEVLEERKHREAGADAGPLFRKRHG
jgi:hypothetical protein